MRIHILLLLALVTINLSSFGQKNLKKLLQADVVADIPICTQTGDQITPVMVSDGAGGFIVAWEDHRDGIPKIYAQRIDATGMELWTGGGVRVSLDTTIQHSSQIVSDNNGGAIIVWANDVVSASNPGFGPYTAYFSAQRMDGNGNLLWDDKGVIVVDHAGGTSISSPSRKISGVALDGTNGAYFLVYEYFWGSSNFTHYDIYVGHINNAGTVLWGGVGNGVSIASNSYPLSLSRGRILSDGQGEAIISWTYMDPHDNGAPDPTHIGVARVDSAGLVSKSVLNVLTSEYSNCSDLAGGSYVCYVYWTSPSTGVLAVQWIDSTGTLHWGESGKTVCNIGGNDSNPYRSQAQPVISPNPAGGLFITWRDFRDGTDADLFAARVNLEGDLPWTNNGIPVCLNDSVTGIVGMSCPSSDSVFITFGNKNHSYWPFGNKNHLYAQLLDGNGNAQWLANGIAVGSDTAAQNQVVVSPNNVGRPFAVWQENEGRDVDANIYGQWIDAAANQSVGTFLISVRNISGYGIVGNDARVSLYNKHQVLVQTQNTDSTNLDINSLPIATFLGIPADTGYSVQVNYITSNPLKIYGNEYWGSRSGFTVVGGVITQEEFPRNAPYTTDLKIYAKNTNQLLTGHIPFGTPLLVSIDIININAPGSVEQSVKCNLTLDRDKQPAYDFQETSTAQAMGIGTRRTFTFDLAPPDSGSYFHVAGSQISSNGVDIQTEGGRWETLPTFIVDPPIPSTALINVQTMPHGCSFIVDDSTYTERMWFVWPTGATHRIGAPSTQAVHPGMQYTWSHWSDSDSMSHSIMTPAGNSTYTAFFDTSYYLTTHAGNGGVVEPSSGWFKNGEMVTITARPSAGWKLTGWTGVGKGSYTGSDTSASITMDSVITESAIFEPATGIADLALGIPSTYILNGNYPNPFNPTTTIRFGVPKRSAVRIAVFTIQGELVGMLVDGEVGPGYHEVRFDGSRLSSGVYLYRVQAGSFVQTKTLLLVK